MTYASAIGHLAQIDPRRLKGLAHIFHRVHSHKLRQNLALVKRQDLSADKWQDCLVATDYRAALCINLAALLERHGLTRTTLKATYGSGPKRGKRVSPRAIGYMLSSSPDAPSPSLDMIAAVASAFDLLPWQILVPGLDPANPPVNRLTPEERKLYADFQRLRASLTRDSTP